MLYIDLSLKYQNFEGIQRVPLAESGWWNVLCQYKSCTGWNTAL